MTGAAKQHLGVTCKKIDSNNDDFLFMPFLSNSRGSFSNTAFY
jgi:hypothetical protein